MKLILTFFHSVARTQKSRKVFSIITATNPFKIIHEIQNVYWIWNNLQYMHEICFVYIWLSYVGESHVMMLIHSISPKVTSHVIFWLQKWQNAEFTEKKRGCHLNSFVFSICALGMGLWVMNSTFQWYVWVRVTRFPLYSHHGQQFTSFILFSKNIHIHILLRAMPYRTHFDPKCVMSFACNIACCYVSFLFRMYVCTYIYSSSSSPSSASSSSLFCVSLPIDLFDLLSKVLLRIFFCHLTH